MGNVWSTCIHLKNGQNYHIEENLKGQREIWMEKIAEIFKVLNKRDLNKFRNLILDKPDQVKELFNLTPKELLKRIKALEDNKKGESSKSNFEEIGDELNPKIKEELDKEIKQVEKVYTKGKFIKNKEIIEEFEEGDFENEEKLKEENNGKIAGKEEVDVKNKEKGKVSELQEKEVLNEKNNERNLFIDEGSSNFMKMKEEEVEKEEKQRINDEAEEMVLEQQKDRKGEEVMEEGKGKILEEVDDIEEEKVKDSEEDLDKSKEGLKEGDEINIKNRGKEKIIEEKSEKSKRILFICTL